MNIAPKQIDEVLESHPAVLEAAAVGVPDRYVGEDVVAFAVLREGLNAVRTSCSRFCESRLGHFKTPSRIHFVRDLPKGPSGQGAAAEAAGGGGANGLFLAAVPSEAEPSDRPASSTAAMRQRRSNKSSRRPGRSCSSSRMWTRRATFSRWAATRCLPFNVCRCSARSCQFDFHWRISSRTQLSRNRRR